MRDNIAQLVAKARSGDSAAFAELMDAYGRGVRRVALQILGDAHEAEDAAQDAWLAASRRLDSLREPAHFGSWLYRVARNVALRRRQQRASHLAHARALAEWTKTSASIPATDEDATSSRLELLPMAMDALSDKDRLVTALHYFSGMSVAEIAGLLSVPEGTIKSRLHHARQRLRKEMDAMTDPSRRMEHVPADFRRIIQGNLGDVPWQTLFSGDFAGWSLLRWHHGVRRLSDDRVPQHWQIAGDGLVGEVAEGGTCLMVGDNSWSDYELSLLITPVWGGNAQVFFRMDPDAGRCYVLDMMLGWQAVAVNRLEHDHEDRPTLTRLSVVNYPVECEREYAVSIAARDQSITTYVDGALVNQLTDPSFADGGIGLNVWRSKTLYRDVRVRLLEPCPKART